MFVKGSIEIVQGVRAFILSFIPAIDNYLFATILLIISMGLYELFISKIDPRSRKEHTRPDWLVIKDLDDLKSKIGEVVVMILIVNFFKMPFNVTYDQPMDLLVLGGGILLIASSLVVTHYVSGMKRSPPRKMYAAHRGPHPALARLNCRRREAIRRSRGQTARERFGPLEVTIKSIAQERRLHENLVDLSISIPTTTTS